MRVYPALRVGQKDIDMPRKLWGSATYADASHRREVYALLDPRDNTIRYVGISIDANQRFAQHLRGYAGSRYERRWLRELREKGLSPTLLILETIPQGPDAYEIACEREKFWIQEMIQANEPLLNRRGIV